MDMEFTSFVKFIKEFYHCFLDIRSVWDGEIGAGSNVVANYTTDLGNLMALFFVIILLLLLQIWKTFIFFSSPF